VPAAERSPADRRSTAWCAVDVAVDSGGTASITVAECAEGYTGPAAAAVRRFGLPTERPRQWRVLLGYVPE
jgi:hypothetical protein